jgi:hypothetical protein
MSIDPKSQSTVSPITPPTKVDESPTREQQALDLHSKLLSANPGCDLEVTLGAKYGPDAINLETRNRGADKFAAGVLAGIAFAGLAGLIGVAVAKAVTPRPQVKSLGDDDTK